MEGNSFIILVVLAVLLAAAVILCVILFIKNNAMKKILNDENAPDKLTGLEGRKAFREYFSMMRSESFKAIYFLAYIGFDIKALSNRFDPEEADVILKQAADTLKTMCGRDHICRYAGGEFAVMHICSNEREAERWIKPILDAMNKPLYEKKADMLTKFRAGLIKLKSSDWNFDNVISLAEKSYSKAVEGSMEYFVPAANELRGDILKLQLDERAVSAVDEHEIEMYLQPIVQAENGKIQGFEALSRWIHPELGVIAPGQYISGMVDSGFIKYHDLYLMENAIKQLKKWESEGREFWISVNLTRETIASDRITDEIAGLVGKYDFDRAKLVIELTEDCLIKNSDTAKRNLEFISCMGFKISLDDLGSGYTMFSDLADYNFDIVKMDKRLIVDAENERGELLLKGLMDTCRSLGMIIVCEGIEKSVQKELVKELGADYIQGFYYYSPMPIGDLERIL